MMLRIIIRMRLKSQMYQSLVMLSLIDLLIYLQKNQLEEDRLIKKKFNKISLKGINKDSAIIILTQKSPIDNVTQGTPVL